MDESARRVSRWWTVAALALCLASGREASAQLATSVAGDVDGDSIVTCRDLSVTATAVGKRTGQAGYWPGADIDRNGVIDARDVAAVERLVPNGALCKGKPNYLVFQGHDGHPDPDDNAAQLAGWFRIQRALANPRVAFGGFVYGDTTAVRKAGMLNGGTAQNNIAKGNYEFHKQFGRPALLTVGLDLAKYADEVTQTYNFAPTALADITTGGQLLYNAVKAAIDARAMDRVVFSAGGGHNAGAEAIALLRHDGYTDAQILEHFAMVQHSAFNWNNVTEATARTIAAPFSIRIQDQNPFSGIGFAPATVSATCTSPEFARAWDVARAGTSLSGIPNHQGTTDMSDAGSHSFASTPDLLDTNWQTRNNSLNLNGNPTAAIKYTTYSTAQAVLDMSSCSSLDAGPAKVWLGLRNSDDVGLRLDVLAEVMVDGEVVRSGRVDNVPAGGSGFNNAVLSAVPFDEGALLPDTSTLAVRLHVRRTCFGGGHAAGTVRLWYAGGAGVDTGSARRAGTRLESVIGEDSATFYLRPAFALSAEPGTSATVLDVPVNSSVACPDRPFTPIGTWTISQP